MLDTNFVHPNLTFNLVCIQNAAIINKEILYNKKEFVGDGNASPERVFS